MASVVSVSSSSACISTAAAAAVPSSSSAFSAKPVTVVGVPALCRMKSRRGIISASASAGDGAREERKNKRVVVDGWMMGSCSGAMVAAAGPAAALVDERLSTEGTGLSLGVSNPLLVWILLGVATLVWALFFTYSSSLPEGDDDSGLAL